MSDYHNYSRDIVIDYSVIDDYDNIIASARHNKAKLARNAKLQFGPAVTPDEELILIEFISYKTRLSKRPPIDID